MNNPINNLEDFKKYIKQYHHIEARIQILLNEINKLETLDEINDIEAHAMTVTKMDGMPFTENVKNSNSSKIHKALNYRTEYDLELTNVKKELIMLQTYKQKVDIILQK